MTRPDDTAHPANPRLHDQVGLTKREVFAMAAMQGMLASDHTQSLGQDMVAEWAVNQADALIGALNAEASSE